MPLNWLGSFAKQRDKKIKRLNDVFFVLSLFILIAQIISGGVFQTFKMMDDILKYYSIIFGLFSIFYAIVQFTFEKNYWLKVVYTSLGVLSFIYLLSTIQWISGWIFIPIKEEQFVVLFSIFISFASLSYKIVSIGTKGLHPSVLFVLSFMLLIGVSTSLLLLPNATTKEISILDALFTATSAATVTGLAVLDTAKDYTFFGKVIILVTIQLGGLGVLTFTNLFALLFRSSTSFQNRLLVSELINESNNSKVYTTLGRIIGITLLVEMVGAVLIYFSIINVPIGTSKVFFSVFHSVSAFCNAGFSTMTNGLFEGVVVNNLSLQIIISWLIITGGIGYFVMINHFGYIKNVIERWLYYVGINKCDKLPKKRVVNINNLLVIYTTLALLVVGTIGFYFLEGNGVLANQPFAQRIVSSFFNSVTTRTAGFNNIDMSKLATPTALMMIFLMWIGASPGSTGGGIKTSGFALAILNLLNQIRGKSNTIIKWRVIPRKTMNQLSAIIFLSIISIAIFTFLLSIFEPESRPIDLFFEVVSAFSTVGLSLGITMGLSTGGKVIIILAMFLGRVSFLTLLIGVYRQLFGETNKETAYYPDENVFIT